MCHQRHFLTNCQTTILALSQVIGTMKILLFGNEYQRHYADELRHLVEVLGNSGADIVAETDFHSYLHNALDIDVGNISSCPACDMEGDVALSIGGDGTFLRTARVMARKDVPILGINTGHLGYLADANVSEIEQVVDELYKGLFKIGRRTMLEISNNCGVNIRNTLALNEVAISRQDNCSMLGMRTWVNGIDLTTYRGDGLVISTPTGSTAYNLSVGGPLVEPTSHVLVLSPISAHSLNMRPLVLRDDSVIVVETSSRTQQYLVSLDGEVYSFPTGSAITVRKSDIFVKVIEPLNHNFADTLRRKLMWGQ